MPKSRTIKIKNKNKDINNKDKKNKDINNKDKKNKNKDIFLR